LRSDNETSGEHYNYNQKKLWSRSRGGGAK